MGGGGGGWERRSSQGSFPPRRSLQGRVLWGLVDEVVGCQWGV